MQLIIKNNKEIQFIFDIFSKYACAFPLKDKKRYDNYKCFPKILEKSNWKPNKLWVDKDSGFLKYIYETMVER